MIHTVAEELAAHEANYFRCQRELQELDYLFSHEVLPKLMHADGAAGNIVPRLGATPTRDGLDETIDVETTIS